ncbi:hypothetical protein GC177_10440 [bacterium]|nr:hypothetical protein [bacterium]
MLYTNDPQRVAREFGLERVRALQYPSLVSRLRGMYVFTDKRSADLAANSWGGHPFVSENLTEISLSEAKIIGIRHDANWITYADVPDWMERYWLGEAHPNHEPIWEVLAEGRLILLGTVLRDKAFNILQSYFPEATVLLETARMAAWIGSDFANIAAFLRIMPPMVHLDYALDMRDLNNEDFIRQLIQLRDSGHPINWDAIMPHLSKGDFVTPDLRPYGFIRTLLDMPYLIPSQI